MLHIGKRNIFTFFARLLNIDNYLSILAFFKVHQDPFRSIFREVFSLGSYPKEIYFKTPIGKKKVTIYSINDFSTFNLIFCRQDYLISQKDKIILDVGSNIGLSALYWLTRNNKNIVYCYEPSSLNLMRLKQNLRQFKFRFFSYKEAVSNKNYSSFLNVENSGVYNSLSLKIMKKNGKEACKVRNINYCIQKIVSKHKRIDMIKIDNEGEEVRTVSKINKKYWKYINCLNVDGMSVSKYVPKNFKCSKKGSAQRYLKKDY